MSTKKQLQTKTDHANFAKYYATDEGNSKLTTDEMKEFLPMEVLALYSSNKIISSVANIETRRQIVNKIIQQLLQKAIRKLFAKQQVNCNSPSNQWVPHISKKKTRTSKTNINITPTFKKIIALSSSQTFASKHLTETHWTETNGQVFSPPLSPMSVISQKTIE